MLRGTALRAAPPHQNTSKRSVATGRLRRSPVASSSRCRLPNVRCFSNSATAATETEQLGDASHQQSTDRWDSGPEDGELRTGRRGADNDGRKKLYEHSTASGRPMANVRGPIFSKAPVFPRKNDSPQPFHVPSPTKDSTLAKIYSALSSIASASKDTHNNSLQQTILLSHQLVTHLVRYGIPLNYVGHHAILERLADRGMIRECFKIYEDMRAVGLPPTLTSLNYGLRAATKSFDDASIDQLCLMINELDELHTQTSSIARPLTPKDLEEFWAEKKKREEASKKVKASAVSAREYVAPPPPPGAATDVTNFNSMTYAILFAYYSNTQRLEDALFLFSAMINSKHTAIAAMQAHMKPYTADYFVTQLCDFSEYKLAVEIAEWLHVEGAGRIVKPTLWLQVARSCALGGYAPGLKTAWGYCMQRQKFSPDEGFVLAALATASRHGDSDFCLTVIRHFLETSSSWGFGVSDEKAAEKAPPLHNMHLAPLLESLGGEGRFAEAARLAGAMAHWGVQLDDACFNSFCERASSSEQELARAISEWQRVIDEGAQAEGSDPASPAVSSSPANVPRPEAPMNEGSDGAASSSSASNRNNDSLLIIDKVIKGEVPSLRGAVEIHTMNALIRSAAALGATEEALNIWEERRYVKSRQPPLQISAKSDFGRERTLTAQSNRVLYERNYANPEGLYNPIGPTAETFDGLLLAAFNRKPPSRNLASSIYQEMRGEAFRDTVTPTARIYERLICAHLLPDETSLAYPSRSNVNLIKNATDLREGVQPSLANISRAFEFFEECKEQDLIPTRASYEALILVSLRRPNDVRWADLVKEMVMETDHRVSRSMSLLIKAVESSRRSKGQLTSYQPIWETYCQDKSQMTQEQSDALEDKAKRSKAKWNTDSEEADAETSAKWD